MLQLHDQSSMYTLNLQNVYSRGESLKKYYSHNTSNICQTHLQRTKGEGGMSYPKEGGIPLWGERKIPLNFAPAAPLLPERYRIAIDFLPFATIFTATFNPII